MNFSPSTFFDLTDVPFKNIFENIDNVWEVLKRIKDYTGGKPLMGKNVTVSNHAVFREGVLLGDNVHIGNFVELKNCIVMNNSHIAHLNYVGDSIIGSNCNISGGAMCANTRLDQQFITVSSGNVKIRTGLLKFGAVVGDKSWVGVNAVLNPGTVLGKGSMIYPLTSVCGTYPDKSIIK